MCALALSLWSSRPRTPVWGRRLHHALKTLGKQWLTYQSAVTVFLSSSSMVATWPNFTKKYASICLKALLFSCEFHRWVLFLGDPHRRLLLRLGIVLVYPSFVSCYDVPNARRPSSSNFHSMWVHQSTLPRFCFSLRLWGTQRAQRFLTPRQSRRMLVRLLDESLMISCISAFVMFGSLLISDSTLQTFSGVTVVTIRPQRSPSSNVLAPDRNRVNHLKTMLLDGD